MLALNVAGMMKNRRLAQSIVNAGMSLVVAKLGYQCLWYGAEFVKVGPCYPFSKLCSQCGWQHEQFTLSWRQWWYGGYGALNHRGLNTSRNLANAGLELPDVGRGDRVSPATPAVVCEAARNPVIPPAQILDSGAMQFRVGLADAATKSACTVAKTKPVRKRGTNPGISWMSEKPAILPVLSVLHRMATAPFPL